MSTKTKIYQLVQPDYECPIVIESFSSIELLCKYVQLNFGKIEYIDESLKLKKVIENNEENNPNIKLNLNDNLKIVEKIDYKIYGSMNYYVNEVIINNEIPKSYIVIDYQLSNYWENNLIEIKNELNEKLNKINKISRKQNLKDNLIHIKYEEVKKLIHKYNINSTLKEKSYNQNSKIDFKILNQYITSSYEIISEKIYNDYSYKKKHGVNIDKNYNSIRIILSLTDEFLKLTNEDEDIKFSLKDFDVKKLIDEKINETLINYIDFFHNKKILLETTKLGLISKTLIYELMDDFCDFDIFNQLIGYDYKKDEEYLYELKIKNNLDDSFFEKVSNTTIYT
jgi:hypothetical protein